MVRMVGNRPGALARVALAVALGAGTLTVAPSTAHGADATGTVQVAVTRPDGTPLASTADAASAWTQQSNGFWRQTGTCATDAAGLCALELAPGSYKIVAHATDQAAWTFWSRGIGGTSDESKATEVSAAAGVTSRIAIRLDAGSTVSGRVTGRASTTATYTVKTNPVKRRILPQGQVPSATVAPDGSYSLQHVPDGEWNAYVTDNEDANPVEFFGGVGFASLAKTFHVAQRSSFRADFDLLQWARIRGTVTTEAGSPSDVYAAVDHPVVGRLGTAVVPDTNGSYEIKLRPDTYSFGFEPRRYEGDVVAGQYWHKEGWRLDADQLVLESGETRNDINMHLTRARAPERASSSTTGRTMSASYYPGDRARIEMVSRSTQVNPTGRIELLKDGKRVGWELLDGTGAVVSVLTGELSAARHKFLAHYEGSDEVRSSYSEPIVVDARAQASVTVSPGRMTTAGGELGLTVRALGGSPAGVVRVELGGKTVGSTTLGASGAGSVRLTALPVGKQKLTVTYVGSDSTKPAAVDHQVAVAPIPARVTARAAAAFVAGRAGALAVTVDAGGRVPAGAVTVKDGASVVGRAVLSATTRGSVRIRVTPRPAGNRNLTVTYGGSPAVTSRTVAARVKVAKAPVTVLAHAGRLKAKRPGRITVSVRAIGLVPTGTVTVKAGAKALGRVVLTPARRGRAVVTIKGLPRGKRRLTVVYAGSSQTVARTLATTVSVR